MESPAEVSLKELKDNLRAQTLGSKKIFKSEIVEINGVEFELRQPTIRERSELRKKCTSIGDEGIRFDTFEFLLWAMIGHTYVPGTNEKVFSEEDYESLCSEPSGSWVDTLSNKAAELCYIVVDEETKKKTSEMIKNGSLSTS